MLRVWNFARTVYYKWTVRASIMCNIEKSREV